MRVNKWIGFRVSAHHPRGEPKITGVVVKAEHEEGRGTVLTLDTGHSIVPRDIVETINPLSGSCRHIPPAALRLEREGLTHDALAVMQGGRKYRLVWSPEGREIAVVRAMTESLAKRLAPQPYRQALGEIYAELVD